MKIRSRPELPQSIGGINFLAPKKPKSFIEKLSDWVKKENKRKQDEADQQKGP